MHVLIQGSISCDRVPTYIACWVKVICVNEVNAIQGCQLAAKCAAQQLHEFRPMCFAALLKKHLQISEQRTPTSFHIHRPP